jgi:hypothetical protein
MVKRSVAAVILLPFITFNIYYIVWLISTKREMVARGADIPTGWLLIVPIANLYWMWKWCVGAEHVTRGKSSAGLNFVLLWLLGSIGGGIIQSSFNSVDAHGGLPLARVA